MRVPDHVVENRRRALAQMVAADRFLSVSEICRRLGISEATARRDLAALEEEQLIQRRFGGAVAFFLSRFPTFEQRLLKNAEAKHALAARAHAAIKPGMIVYFDGGTTPYFAAQEVEKKPITPITAVTPSMPAAELLSRVDGVEVHLLGGRLVVTQSVLLGRIANASASTWEFDLAIMSAEGMDSGGIWNSQPEVVSLQRLVLGQARRVLMLLDKSKLGQRTAHSLCGWTPIFELITDATPEELKQHSIPENFWPTQPAS